MGQSPDFFDIIRNGNGDGLGLNLSLGNLALALWGVALNLAWAMAKAVVANHITAWGAVDLRGVLGGGGGRWRRLASHQKTGAYQQPKHRNTIFHQITPKKSKHLIITSQAPFGKSAMTPVTICTQLEKTFVHLIAGKDLSTGKIYGEIVWWYLINYRT